jgi:hypothetical protein
MLAMVLFSKVSFLMLVVVFLVDDEAFLQLLRHRLTRTRGQPARLQQLRQYVQGCDD